MAWVFLWLGLAFASQIWLSLRVGKSNIPLAIATFFIGPPAALYTLFKQRGDEATSVTVPFVANLVFTVLFFVSSWQIAVPLLEAQQAATFGVPVAAAPMPTAAPASAPPAPASAVEMAASAGEPAAVTPADAVDNFSAALKAAGLNHTVTRMAATANLPAGVVDAALFSVTPMGAAAAASAASAPAATELPATLFKCESANACRNLAGTYMQQSGPEKRRVLQNGLLMLLMPPAAASDTDLTPTAVASVFRKLS